MKREKTAVKKHLPKRKDRAKASTKPRRLRALAILGVISCVLVAAAFVSAPDKDEKRAIVQRDAVEHALQLTIKGDVAGSAAILEPLVKNGHPDRAMARALLANYEASGRLADHARLISDNADIANVLRPDDLHNIVQIYAQHGMRDEAVKLATALDLKGVADISELAILGQFKADTDDKAAAAILARRIAPVMRKGADSKSAGFVIRQLADTPEEIDALLDRWLGSRPDLGALLSISSDLVASGRAKFVMTNLVARQSESAQARSMYSFALANLAQSGPDERRAITSTLIDQLRSAPEGEAFDHALYDVLTFADLDVVVDAIGPSGEWRAPRIRPSLVYALETTGRSAQLRTLLVKDAVREDASVDDRRSLAGELTRLGYPLDAVAILKRVAATEGPKSQAMNDLMYVWHSYGQPVDARWMGDQARRAEPAEADGWISALASASPQEAVKQISRIEAARGPRSGHLALLKARYLAWQGDSRALRETLSRAAVLTLDDPDFAELGVIACQVSDTEAAYDLVSQGGERRIDPDMRQCATRLLAAAALGALSKGDKAKAKTTFEQMRKIDDGTLAQLRNRLILDASVQGTPAPTRRNYARQLVGLGYPADAAGLLKLAAVSEGPSGGALSDLMFIWASNDLPVDAAWMGDQAKRSAANADGWIATLAGVSPEAAIEQITRIESSVRSDKLLLLKARYLAWQGDSSKLRSALAEASTVSLAPAALTEIGNIACQVGDAETVLKLVAANADERSARPLRRCASRLVIASARTAMTQGDKTKATAAFAQARKLDDAALTSQDYFDYGLIVGGGGATELYMTALDRLPPADPIDVPTEIMRATIQSELKRYPDARRSLERVLQFDPTQARVRLQLAEICLIQGDYARALELSNSPAGAPRARNITAS